MAYLDDILTVYQADRAFPAVYRDPGWTPSSSLLEAISPAKCGIVGYMAALAVARCSLMSWCSWSKRPPR